MSVCVGIQVQHLWSQGRCCFLWNWCFRLLWAASDGCRGQSSGCLQKQCVFFTWAISAGLWRLSWLLGPTDTPHLLSSPAPGRSLFWLAYITVAEWKCFKVTLKMAHCFTGHNDADMMPASRGRGWCLSRSRKSCDTQWDLIVKKQSSPVWCRSLAEITWLVNLFLNLWVRFPLNLQKATSIS